MQLRDEEEKQERPTDIVDKIIKADEAAKQRRKDEASAPKRFKQDKAFLDTVSKGARGGRVRGKRRNMPDMPQAYVSLTVKQSADAHGDRDEAVPESKRILPLGSKECMDIVPGELVMTTVKPKGWVPTTLPGDAQVEVTSTPNGLSADMAMQFVGFARTANSGAEDGGARSAVHIAGTATTLNRGFNAIRPFVPLVATVTPNTYTDPRTGHTMPFIDESETGQPADKFHFGIHELDSRTWLLGTEKLRRWFTEERKTTRDNAAMLAKVTTRLAELSGPKIETECVEARYLFWYTLSALGEAATQENFDMGQFFVSHRNKFKDTTDAKEFYEANGLTKSQENKVEQDMIAAASQRQWPAVGYSTGLGPWIQSNLEKACAAWGDYLERMRCGIATNYSSVGGETDVLIDH